MKSGAVCQPGTAGVTGPVAAGVEETGLGAQLVIDATDAAGGIPGQRMGLITLHGLGYGRGPWSGGSACRGRHRADHHLFQQRFGGFAEALGPHAHDVSVAQVFPFERSMAMRVVKDGAALAAL